MVVLEKFDFFYFEVSRKKNLLGIVYNMVTVERFYFIFV